MKLAQAAISATANGVIILSTIRMLREHLPNDRSLALLAAPFTFMPLTLPTVQLSRFKQIAYVGAVANLATKYFNVPTPVQLMLSSGATFMSNSLVTFVARNALKATGGNLQAFDQGSPVAYGCALLLSSSLTELIMITACVSSIIFVILPEARR